MSVQIHGESYDIKAINISLFDKQISELPESIG